MNALIEYMRRRASSSSLRPGVCAPAMSQLPQPTNVIFRSVVERAVVR